MFISNRIRRIFAEFGHILPKAFCATPPSIVLRRSAEDSLWSNLDQVMVELVVPLLKVILCARHVVSLQVLKRVPFENPLSRVPRLKTNAFHGSSEGISDNEYFRKYP